MVKPRILFIEEDPTLLRGISWLLKDNGYDVVALSAAGNLSSVVERRSPDLILLDLDSRAHDNHRLIAQIRSDRRWIDIPLVTTGSDSSMVPADRIGGQGPVTADFIPKPLRVSDLLARVQAQLRVRTVLRNAFESLRNTEEELQRAKSESDSRRDVVEILQEVNAEPSSDGIFSILTRRLLASLSAADCAIFLASPGERIGHIVASHGSPVLKVGPVALDQFPEVTTALDNGGIVLIENVQSGSSGAVEDAEDDRILRPFARIRSIIAIPFDLDGSPGGVLLVRRSFDEPPFSDQDAELALAVIASGVVAAERARVIERARADNARLEALAQTDPLTRVLNRRALMDRLTAELDRATRYNSIVSLLMVDLDYFKRLNDSYGHVAGDEALRWVAQALQAAVRSVDLVARYGGEEFAIVLPETTAEGAFVFAERIRERIEAGKIRANGFSVRLTVSIGVAAFPSPRASTVDEMIGLADEALYRAKAAGRNAVRT